MLVKNKHNGYALDGRRTLYFSGGGGGGTQQVNQTTSNIPNWLRPQTEAFLGAGMQQLFNTEPVTDSKGRTTYQITGMKPFVPYSANPEDYVAGFSPLQQQVQGNVANLQMPGQFSQGTQFAKLAGMRGMGSANQALGYGMAGYGSGALGEQLGVQGGGMYGGMGAGYGGQAAGLVPQALGYGSQGAGYGQTAADIGQMALQAQGYGMDVGQQARNYAAQAAGAGRQYEMGATNPYAVQAYMSPYTQNVIDAQMLEAQRQADIASTQRGAQFARAGAFGGGRQAIENAEAARNLAGLKNQIVSQGLQNAFQNAQQAQQIGANLGLQGLSGAQAGLGTALQGGQLGLSGIGQAIAGQQAGMQGAGMGLQGIGQAANLYGVGMQGADLGLRGLQSQLAGTAQGMQGAGMGLQGVSGAQAGYGLGNQAAQILGSLGTQQLAGQTGILGLQNQIGGQQQEQIQNIINQAIQTYAQGQNQPMQSLGQFSSLLRGYAVPGQTMTQYQAPPSGLSQLVAAGTGAYGLSQLAGRKKGGQIKTGGIERLALRRALKGGRA